jgi:hypothetical protein
MKKGFAWLSGLFTGLMIGAIVACPAKLVSVPLTLILAIIFGYLAAKK